MISGFLSRNAALCFFYLAVISLIAAIITIYDKIAAKINPQGRIPEKTLLFLSAVGGSAVMFLTMLVIRHKTKHVKFMLGIPLIMLVQAAALWAVFHFQV